MGSSRRLVRIFAEFIGTLLLAFAVVTSKGDPVAVGFALWVAFMITGLTSGAQFNPAVSTGAIIRNLIMSEGKRKHQVELFLYIPTQILGAIFGALLAWAVSNNTFELNVGDGYLKGEAFLGELVYTTVLVVNALMVGEYEDSKFMSSLAVPTSVVLGDLSIGLISGGCFNPAIGIGVNAVYAWDHSTDHNFGNIWIYIIAPTLGGLIGAIINAIFRKEVKRQSGKAKKIEEHQQAMMAY